MMYTVSLIAPSLLLSAVSAFIILPDSINLPSHSQPRHVQRASRPSYQQQPLTPSSTASIPLPLVIWHGLGDNFENEGLQSAAELANLTNPGTYTHIIHLGDTGSSDRSATFFGNLTEQVSDVCTQLSTDPVLSTAPAINALGFSQGGQFLRAYIQRCNNPPVYNLLTFGSQHNGISEFQSCEATDWTCNGANALLRSGTWSSFVQSRLVPAQYFRDPEDMDSYLEHSNFLADINNERELKNTTYADNLNRLNKFVMFLFEEDTTVVPMESGWFAEVNRTGEKDIVTPLKERALYKEDWLGLKRLDEKGGLVFDTVPGGHMRLTDKVLTKAFKKFFAPVSKQDLDQWRESSSSVAMQHEL